MGVSKHRAVKEKRTSISPGQKILTLILDNEGIFWTGEREHNSLTLRYMQDSTKTTSGELSVWQCTLQQLI